jgi:hypothetical protein
LYDSPTMTATIAVTASMMITIIGCLSRFIVEGSAPYSATVAPAVALRGPVAPLVLAQRERG